MADLLARLFIKDYQNTKSPAVRAAYGELSGAVGIFINLLLSAAKFFVGTVSGSISISADAANNLSDAGSSASNSQKSPPTKTTPTVTAELNTSPR